MAVEITRTAWIDNDGMTLDNGTVINNAEKQLLYDQIDGALAELDDDIVDVASDLAALETLTTATRGSWTPVLGGSGGTSGQTYGTQIGRWEKNQGVVRCWGRMTLSAKGTITGDVQIQGLPVAAANVLHQGSLIIGYFFGLSTNWIMLTGYVRQNESVVAVVGRASAGTGVVSLAAADIGNSTDLIFSFQYEAA